MTDEKKVKAISDIHRALGIIEGLSCGMPEGASMLATCATEMIDEALEVLLDAT